MAMLEGKVVPVTGVAARLRRATALACAREGAKVVVSNIEEMAGQETVSLNEKSNCPGGTDMRILAEHVTGGKQTTREIISPLRPVGRIGTPGEVAVPIVWLCSAKSSLATCASIPIDGGYVPQ